MKKNASQILKILIILTSLTGVILGMIYFQHDGYSHPTKRLLYFTTQSNIWICAIAIALLVISRLEKGLSEKSKERIYALRYVLVVSISITGLVFWTLLAPFASEEGYHAWSVYSLLTHVFTPVISIVDFFCEEYRIKVKRVHIFASIIPPLCYFIVASIIGSFGVDFGRGDNFPYFFMDLNSPAGIFGYSKEPLALGSFWWILFFLFLVLGIATAFGTIENRLYEKGEK